MKVWKLSVTKEAGKFLLWEPIEVDLPEETAQRFQWDRINRLDFVNLEEAPNGKVVFLARTRAEIDALNVGFWQRGLLEETWDEKFSEERKQAVLKAIDEIGPDYTVKEPEGFQNELA